MFGLHQEEMLSIQRCFEAFPQIDKVILYGSRATGNYRQGSDIDITLMGENLTNQNTVYPLDETLDDLLLPYSFDISIFTQLKKLELIEHIKSEGKMFYKRERV